MSLSKKYTRRNLLERMGGAAACAALMPFIPYTEAEAAEVARLRYWNIFTPVAPEGFQQEASLPTSTAEMSDINFRANYADLNTLKSKISLYRGLINKAGEDSNVSGGHGGQAAGIFTGTPLLKGKVGSGSALKDGAGVNEASSICQFIAGEFLNRGIKTPLRDIRYGWGDGDVDEIKTGMFNKGVAMTFERDAGKVFDRVFQVAGSGSVSTGQDLSYRGEILNAILGDVNRVKKKLSSTDSKRLDRHLDAINELSRTFEANNPVGGGSCKIDPSLKASATGAMDKDASLDVMAKITAIAFNCDLTRVASTMCSGYNFYKDVGRYNISNYFSKLNTTVFHGVTHDNGGAEADRNNLIYAVMKWRANLFLNICKQLDSYEDPTGGTLLDKTVVHWVTEHMRDHYNNDSFNMIGGGAGHFLMGKQVIVGGANNLQNRLLVSIANAMGISIENFGQYATGPLATKYLV